MGTSKGFVLVATAISATFLLLGIGTLGAKPDKPDPNDPVLASDTMLVPKVTLHGGQSRSVRGGGQKRAGAATGYLGEPCTGRKYAIVIGISEYPGLVNDLDFADDDALTTTQVLSDNYGFNGITTLIDKNATRQSILDAIGGIRKVAHSVDEVVFFFSGHGMTGMANDGDAERVDEAIVVNPPASAGPFANYQPLWDGELERAFRNFPTSRIIFIFDMCDAGGMDDLRGPGRVLLMASGERGDAYEGSEWAYGDSEGHGEFTYYLAIGIATGDANIHDYLSLGVALPEQVTAEEAFDYAKANCTEDSPEIDDSFLDDLLP